MSVKTQWLPGGSRGVAAVFHVNAGNQRDMYMTAFISTNIASP
jgi:hypothetical protein